MHIHQARAMPVGAVISIVIVTGIISIFSSVRLALELQRLGLSLRSHRRRHGARHGMLV